MRKLTTQLCLLRGHFYFGTIQGAHVIRNLGYRELRQLIGQHYAICKDQMKRLLLTSGKQGAELLTLDC